MKVSQYRRSSRQCNPRWHQQNWSRLCLNTAEAVDNVIINYQNYGKN